jgi:two-component system response regulator AtoC
LKSFAWPGNVREVENVMGRAVLLAGDGDIEPVLARELGSPSTTLNPGRETLRSDDLRLQPRVDALECELIENALAQSDDNKAKAARALEISERTLWYKLKK